MHLKNKKALVIGGTRGIGAAVAERFAKEGADVQVSARSSSNSPFPFIPIDLTDLSSVKKSCAAIQASGSSPDIVFFSSSSPQAGPITELSQNDWGEGLRMILTGPLEIAKAFLPHMEAKGYGRLIFMSSAAAKEPISGLELSGALRAALRSVTSSLARAHIDSGITVNSLLPALVDTEHLRKVAGSDEKLEEWKALVPMHRFAKPEEIAAYAAFLASSEASYVTGQSLAVDGGYLRAY